jgi:hypothetical protein
MKMNCHSEDLQMNEETNYRRFWRSTVICIALCSLLFWLPMGYLASCFLCGVGGAVVAYYNEIDLAQHLRNLIDAGHIAPGVVDTRSIEDVTPNDLIGFNQCHFFAGIGGWSLRCVAQDGQTVARHGQHHAPASLSARQGTVC